MAVLRVVFGDIIKLALIFFLFVSLIAIARSQPYPEMVSGVIIGISPPDIAIETSPGKQLVVNISVAKSEDHIGSPIVVGRRVVVHGWHRGDKFFAGAVHKGQ
jgi:hypothetical protein